MSRTFRAAIAPSWGARTSPAAWSESTYSPRTRRSTLDEYIAKEAGTGQVQELTLDGRRAALLPSVNSSPACALNVETEFGYIVVTRNILDSHPPRDQWCDGIEDMMRIFLRYLPEGA